MSKTSIGILIGLALAAIVAWQLGGSVGVGVLGGYLLGASLFGLGHAWQRKVVEAKPEKSLNTLVILALFKLGVLMAAWLVLRFVDGAAERVDMKAFLLAYVTAVLLVTFVGSYDASLIIKNRRAQTS